MTPNRTEEKTAPNGGMMRIRPHSDTAKALFPSILIEQPYADSACFSSEVDMAPKKGKGGKRC